VKVEISHPDKLLFPDDGITKADLADYYERVAEWMLPHLHDRPVSMQRFPDGIGGKGFFHKDAPDYFPDWIARAELPKAGGTVTHVLIRTGRSSRTGSFSTSTLTRAATSRRSAAPPAGPPT
jgi:DNA primase